MTLTLQAAQSLAQHNRAEGIAALNELFRTGRAPAKPLDGRYTGGLVALNIEPGITQLAQAIANMWLPWKGKRFDAATQTGDNILRRDSFALAHVIWPTYHHFEEDTPETYRAFTFRTYIGKGMFDPDLDVLKLDYDSPDNPGKDVRRVLDEVVELPDGVYLGKAHLHFFWGEWKTVAFFSLTA
jgi:hypothetical protein